MPRINVSKETHARLQAFQRVVRALTNEEKSLDELAETLIRYGIDETLATLWGALEPGMLVKTLLDLAARHPEQIFDLTADYLEAGAGVIDEELSRRFGFRPPEPPAS
jgi:hypothetical protein